VLKPVRSAAQLSTGANHDNLLTEQPHLVGDGLEGNFRAPMYAMESGQNEVDSHFSTTS
jgi:hypothetical protein